MIVALTVMLTVLCAAYGLRWTLHQYDDAPTAAAPAAPRLDDAPPPPAWDALDEIQLTRLLGGAPLPPRPLFRPDPAPD